MARPSAPTKESMLSGPKPVSGEYVYIRRVMPFRPRMNSGKKVTLKDITIHQKECLPIRSFRRKPKTFGHQ
ncbi:hypothetical protein D3C71_1693430 [compost metagenome]